MKDNLINLDSDSIQSDHSDFLEYENQFNYVRATPLVAASPCKAADISEYVVARGEMVGR